MRRPGSLRVIGGELRGRRLRAPAGTQARPTADRVRKAVFDILGRAIVGSTFLDAYAGTGAVGIEALSRGASEVTFVEENAEMAALLARNLETSGAGLGRVRVVGVDMARALSILEREGRRFSLVYLDPPYGGGELDRALRLLSRSRVLADGATVIAEHESRQPAPVPESLRLVRTAAYGRATLSFLALDGVR